MNDILFLSLLQDIKYLEHILKEIHSRDEFSLEITSWKSPNVENTLDLLGFKIDKGQSTTLQYTTILEITIDRLYVIINYLLKYSGFVNKSNCPGHVNIPNKLTLGGQTFILWSNVKDIYENRKYKSKERNLNLSKDLTIFTNKSAQTEQVAMLQCDSCFVALNCIKQLSSHMEIIVKDSFTEKNRKHLQPDIFEMTKFGCMNSTINALIGDINKITESRDNYKKDLVRESSDKVLVESKLLNASRIIHNFEIIHKELDTKHKNNLLETENLKQLITNVQTSNKSLENENEILKNKVETLENKLDELKINLDTKDFERIQFDRTIEQLEKKEALAVAEKDMWKLRFNSNHEENVQLKLINKNLFQEVSQLKESVQKIEESYHNLNKTIELNDSKLNHKTDEYGKLLDRVQDIVYTKVLTQEKVIAGLQNDIYSNSIERKAITISSGNNLSKSNVKGNPIDDMTKQVDENKAKMKSLEEENTNLVNTIWKLQQIKTKKRRVIF